MWTKSVYLILMIITVSAFGFSQTINIHINDGSVHQYDIVNIDSITFTIVDTSITYLINDDFESYDLGTFPSSGGWYERYNGSGQNIIDDAHSYSGTKSFRLQGLPNWSASIENHNAGWQINSDEMGYEIFVYPEAGDLRISFFDYDPIWGASWGYIRFDIDGNIYAIVETGSVLIMPYSFGQWYKLKVTIDNLPPYPYKVWINEEYKGQYDSPDNPNHSINESYFLINSGHAGNYGWFDDAKVWYLNN